MYVRGPLTCALCKSTYVPESELPPNTLQPTEIRIDHVLACLDDPIFRVVANPAMLKEFEERSKQ